MALLFPFYSCVFNEDSLEIDFLAIKEELELTPQQEKAFQVVVKEYIIKRRKLIYKSDLKADSGNRLLLSKVKNSYKDQEKDLYFMMDERQQQITHQFIKKHMPGQFHYADDIREELSKTLSLDSYQKRQYRLINATYDKIYSNMNTSDYDYRQHVTAHWNQLYIARKNAIQRVFSEEQFKQYEEIVQRVNYERS
ncbi:hypothetical protein [Flammeovirga aprica]|uniref:Uncharacterized protein n=1 Tax=Flammeovirga aprica JL-4 TaxID=694437 RepID=A0A7X9RT39_9BACT|nr:hypothetical protein [Flammeovirga aprica]NME68010.1 hypothetical protein [Flammeovirga aprica JL-4]